MDASIILSGRTGSNPEEREPNRTGPQMNRTDAKTAPLCGRIDPERFRGQTQESALQPNKADVTTM